jgi:hypothetical protein
MMKFIVLFVAVLAFLWEGNQNQLAVGAGVWSWERTSLCPTWEDREGAGKARCIEWSIAT